MLKNDKVKKQQNEDTPQEQMKLDDARRVKVLSPGMLVFKRFIRNKLAVTGIIILAFMFAFAFIGPLFSPYKIAQTFFKDVMEEGKYASGKINRDSRIYGIDDSAINSALLKELGNHKDGDKYVLEKDEEIMFSASKKQYVLRIVNPDPNRPTTEILEQIVVASTTSVGKNVTLNFEDADISDALKAAIQSYVDSGSTEKEIEADGTVITVVKESKLKTNFYMVKNDPIAVSTFNIYTALRGRIAELQSDPTFLHGVSSTIQVHETATLDGEGNAYTIVPREDGSYAVANSEGTELFLITRVYRSATMKLEVENEQTGETETKDVDFVSTLEDPAAFNAMLAEQIKAGEDALVAARQEAIDSGASDEEIYKAMTEVSEVNFCFPTEESPEYTVVFDHDETTFSGEYTVMTEGQVCMTVLNNFDPIETKYDRLNSDYRFLDVAEKAIADEAEAIEYDGETYKLEKDPKYPFYTVYNAAGEKAVMISEMAYGPTQNGTELTVDFILKFQEAVWNKASDFNFINQYGEETHARLHLSNENNEVWAEQKKTLLDTRAPINSEHLLGTDAYAMDVVTRLMYGGRISLLVGFVVIFFEIIIGVIIGGISGYFGGVVDTILMRFVELFNAIPFYPMLIILGSVMDNLHVSSTPRLMLTMAILGILGWTGIARTVRGQILSLREQDFMIATEATGIRTSRRIFKHLVPNVMPLLIVYATAGLGGIILTEATLGFLGLGVKYPMASWGSIINQATDMQIMSTNWWIWIPAGTLILLTVLGFNFVGDGLRDAFDPKMKR